VKNFFAGVAGETREAIVEFDVRTVGEEADAEGVWAIAKSGGEELLRVTKGFFGVEKMLGEKALAAIVEEEADGGAENGGGDGEPSEERLLAGDGAAHEDHEEGNEDEENLRGDEPGDGRSG